MIVPFDRDRIDEMTDDDVRAAYVAAGLDVGYANVLLPVLRGQARDPELPIL